MSAVAKSAVPVAAKLIFFIGMSAAGKTYWGKRVAEHYHLHFVDLDTLIEEKEKATIASLFGLYGEAVFRGKEHAWLEDVISAAKGTTLVACGGGTPCFHDNMTKMNNRGRTVYLYAEIPQLLANLEKSGIERPLLSRREHIAADLQELLQKREAVYRQAHYILQTKDISISTFAEIVSSCTDKR